MGTSSCLKIIACGGRTSGDDDHNTTQTKASGDKTGWSFRKRSGRHRVLGNNCSSETANFTDKEAPQVSDANLHAPLKSTILDEKPDLPKPAVKFGEVPALEYDGEPKPSMEVVAPENDCSAACEIPKVSQIMIASDNDRDSTSYEAILANAVSESGCTKPSSELVTVSESAVLEVDNDQFKESITSESEVTSEDGSDASDIVDEAVAIIIQAAIRRFLVQKGFEQLKRAVKLQALLRGYLVRRNAVETLHCIRGIVKVQGFFRARSSKSLDQDYKPSRGQFSAANLLKNRFARLLLDSTPKPKSVNIRCDPLNPNSTWEWLERWMSVSKCEAVENVEPSIKLDNDNQILTKQDEAELELSSTPLSESLGSKFAADDVTVSPEFEESTLDQFMDTVELQSSSPVLVEQAHTQMTEVLGEDVNPNKVDAHVTEVTDLQAEHPIKLDAHVSEISDIQAESIYSPNETATEIQHHKLSAKRLASEKLNGEGKKVSFGSRKPSDPVFTATLSKFEELTSVANSGKLFSSSLQEEAETNVDTFSVLEESVDKTSDVGVVPSDPHILVASSECGTELSISSTLDSPDRCEPDKAHPEPNTKAGEMSPGLDCEEGPDHEGSCMLSNHKYDFTSQTAHEEEAHAVNSFTDDSPVVAEASPQVEQKPETIGSYTETFAHVSTVIDLNSSSVEHKHDLIEPETSVELDSAKGHTADKFSAAASPNSHITVLESQGTPSSQVSVKRKKKSDKSGSNAKHSSLSAGKKTPNPKFDLGVRISVEHSPKDQKSGKRRSSFGSTKSDNVDQEPRDSSSHVSLPSYMQATKSARAKVQSPRSSPDVHDKEVISRKRHSLPGAGGRQGSPRVQQSEGVKAIGSNSSTERKWQR